MRKVWILEEFITPERMEEILQMFKAMCEHITDPAKKQEEQAAVEKYQNHMAANPTGYWSGIVGRSIYSQFCYDAHNTMRSHKVQYRVVQAEIADDAKYWLHYTNPVVNEGVYRYLCATL